MGDVTMATSKGFHKLMDAVLESDKKRFPLAAARAAAALLDKIVPVTNRPPGTFLASEYARENGVSAATATVAIRKLAEAGKIRRVKFRAQQDDGVWKMRSGWELVPQGSER